MPGTSLHFLVMISSAWAFNKSDNLLIFPPNCFIFFLPFEPFNFKPFNFEPFNFEPFNFDLIPSISYIFFNEASFAFNFFLSYLSKPIDKMFVIVFKGVFFFTFIFLLSSSSITLQYILF